MSKSVEELKNMIRDSMNIDEIIESFERWYSPMEEESALLFETGTFDFTGKRQFYFSLVKQFPAEDDEYYQIHTDILYNPDSENKAFPKPFGMKRVKRSLIISEIQKSLNMRKIIDMPKSKSI